MKAGIEFETRGGVRYAYVHGPITDTHMHPRIFDGRMPSGTEIPNGKAGLDAYTKAALLGAIITGMAMPNESLRLYAPENEDQTELVPFPIVTVDRLLAALSVITQHSRIRMGMHMGVDPAILGYGPDFNPADFTTKYIKEVFSNPVVQRRTGSVKVFGNQSFGGLAIPLDNIPEVGHVWHEHMPVEPVTMHLEDEAVAEVLEEWPADIPAHIAHVSSQQELEAIIIQKENGKNITCEATPHHLTLTELTLAALGGLGCVKPRLKKLSDVKFLRDNMRYIDTFASDCAPHRHIDKVGIDGMGLEKPAPGFANHSEYMATWLGGLEEGWLDENQLYERIVTNPINRFGLPRPDVSASFELTQVSAAEVNEKTEYGCSPFIDSPLTPLLVGRLDELRTPEGKAVAAGWLNEEVTQPRYENLISF